MKSTTIKTKLETDVLFTGNVPGLGETLLVCAYINSKRIYARITGNINAVYVTSGSYISGTVPCKLCAGSNFNIAYSDILDDIDAETFGTISNETLPLVTKLFGVK